MIYVYVEDKTEGFALMKNAIDMYLSNKNVTLDTLDGVKNMANHIRDIQLNANDSAYYIYDNVPENLDVQKHLSTAMTMISHSKYRNQIYLIPIFCCEHSVLTADDVEIFAHVSALRYIYLLKQYQDLNSITRNTKYNKEFKPIYDKYRKERERTLKSLVRKQKIKDYTKNDIELGVSAEKLCKGIFQKAFNDPDIKITNTLGNCWNEQCCFKKNIICSMHTSTRKLESTEKRQFLVERTVYYKIIKQIAKEQNLELKETKALDLGDITFSKQALKVFDTNKKTNSKLIKQCMHNIEEYLIYTENDYSKAIKFCISCGYTEQEVETALNLMTQKE